MQISTQWSGIVRRVCLLLRLRPSHQTASSAPKVSAPPFKGRGLSSLPSMSWQQSKAAAVEGIALLKEFFGRFSNACPLCGVAGCSSHVQSYYATAIVSFWLLHSSRGLTSFTDFVSSAGNSENTTGAGTRYAMGA
jgi:hypothetical protein